MPSFAELSPVVQVLLATGFTWGLTALGAGIVFLTKKPNPRLMDAMLGFAAGVMIAASFFSLLLPAAEFAEAQGVPVWLPTATGFLAGGLFLRLVDRVLPHLHPGLPPVEAEGPPTTWRRGILLVTAITIHNIPEGLAIGVAFGAVAADLPAASLAAAVALAVGIGIQNFPEGAAVSLPLRREGIARGRSFFFGQLSAAVEPIAGVLGVIAVSVAQPMLPYALSFAAGAMILRCGRGVDPRVATWWPRRPGDDRIARRVRGDDDARSWLGLTFVTAGLVSANRHDRLRM